MKRITLTLASALFSLGFYAQDNPNFLVAATTGNTSSNVSLNAACEQGSLADFNYAVSGMRAFDVSVGAAEILTATSLTFQYLTIDDSQVDEVTVLVFDSSNDLPATEIFDFIDIMPTSQTDVGVFDTGQVQYQIREVLIDFSTPFDLVEGEYWISVFGVTSTDAAIYLISTNDQANFINEPAATYDTATETWSSSSDSATPFEVLYLLEGDCVLSVNDNLLSQIAIYPNPATDVLNINVPGGVSITGATLYDVLGKNTGVVIADNQMNVAALSRGVYMLSVTTTEGTLTQKIVKQ